MTMALALGMALGLLTLESVAAQFTDHAVAGLDVTVVIVAHLALKALPLEGALTSFGVGYLLDILSGRPSGLYTFLAVLAFVGGRLGSSLVVVNSRRRFALFAGAVEAGHAVVGWLLQAAVARDPVGTGPLAALPLQVLLTAGAAFLLYPALQVLEPGEDRSGKELLR
jgi:rod shape-determining protein MreD